MIRFVSAVGIGLLILVSFALYNGVYQVKAQHQALEALKRETAREAEAIRVLKAEWSYLNQPERLQTLARRHLSLAPTGASQITVLASLPLREAGPTSPVVEAADLPTRVMPRAPLPRAKPDLSAPAERQ